MVTSKEAPDQLGYGGRHGFHWSFYAILERFLRGDTPAPGGNRQICIENIILGFHSAETELPYPPDNLGFGMWVDKHGGSRPINGQEQEDESLACKARPEWLLHYLGS
ncbi:uncharacterized protein N7487_001837 [Penicillium crustosum]|uniref:uncharacterized protein n=1 Tax=Penicillium crustosum TaxID=36656 RepID=UPI0023900CF0|nr:uncharacterized protein N7487_001837 [Penicillium crustosum]KAJ5418287.1 hypothetical protein N7487_001837 [Penicillium crustosum]